MFLSDSDADGSHINSLLLSFFAVYMPRLIIDGYVYKGVPPLYGIPKGKKTIYFSDRLDFIKYTQKEYSKKNTISDINDKVLTTSEVTKLLYDNMDYPYEMGVISRSFAIDEKLLNMILVYRNESFNKFKKKIESSFRFMDVEKIDGTVVIDGLIGNDKQRVVLSDSIIRASEKILHYIENVNIYPYYKLNGIITPVYEIIQDFEKVNGTSKLTRYKGLGEMDEHQLSDSTLHPDANRSLIQYTMEDINDVSLLRSIESDKVKIISNLKVTRQDIIG